jgi:hypothetical protein
MTVKQFLENVDGPDEISEWMAYFDLEDPERAAWQRTSLLAANITNMANLRGQKKYPESVKSDHFMPTKRERVQTPREQLDTFKALVPK